ncbi:LrgB family protein [Cohnella terricola]|uniref:LrgB family protein n=1 Tax=Cohnella terricola TaxID=1289167 RepID=A0A559JLG7_9BACL|nr:LrgB family protein [Cohnella terricola]TVY00719.1 LrgB family protein [Cohnella terricola]
MLSAMFWLVFTVAVYLASKMLYARFPKTYLTPLLVSPIVVIAVIEISGVSFKSYDKGAHWLSEMIEPATIALAVTLHKHLDVLKKNAAAILAGVGGGTFAAIVTSVGMARMMRLSPEVMDSLVPRSATTPIAVTVSGMIGGLPTITAVATLVTGLLGMIAGPLVVKWCRIRHPVARGILFGTSAHSAGISKALEYGAVTGSVAGIAMLFTALITLCLAPWLMVWFN